MSRKIATITRRRDEDGNAVYFYSISDNGTDWDNGPELKHINTKCIESILRSEGYRVVGCVLGDN